MSVEKIRSEAARQFSNLAKRRILMLSTLFGLALIAVLGVATAMAVCGVPTAYVVTNSGTPPTANWTQPTLWQGSSGFPGCTPGDSAADNFPPIQPTITVNSTIPPIIGMNFANSIVDLQPGGSLTLSGTGSFSSSGKIVLNGGTLTIASGGTLTVGGPNFVMNGGSIDIQVGGQLNFTANQTVSIGGGTITNAGTIDIPDGTTVTLQSGAQLGLNGGSITGDGILENKGLVQNTGGTSVIHSSYDVFAGPSFRTEVAAGMLSLQGGGTGDAPFQIDSGATLELFTNGYVTTPNAVIAGPGTLQFDGGGALTANGLVHPSNLTMIDGELSGDGFVSIAGLWTWSGGILSGTGGSELAGTGVGSFDGARGQMVLNDRTLNIYGTANLSATSYTLDLQNNAALNIYGTFNFTDDSSITESSCCPSVTISPNGKVQKTGGTGYSAIMPPASNNFQVYVFTGTLDFMGGGSHDGSFYTAQDATLMFSDSSMLFTANSSIFGDGTVAFSFVDAEMHGSYDVGSTFINGPTFIQVNSPMKSVGLTFNGGELDTDTADFTLTGNGTWSGGEISSYASGSFIVASGATLTIDAAASDVTLDDAKFVNNGTVNYTASSSPGPGSARAHVSEIIPLTPHNLVIGNGTVVTNGGTFSIQSDQDILHPAVLVDESKVPSPTAKRLRHRPTTHVVSSFEFINNGTLSKTSGTGTTDFEPTLENDGTILLQAGTLNFVNGYTQTATGTTTLAGGTLAAAALISIDGGVVNGAGNINANLTNSAGQIAPGALPATFGTLVLNGTYTQTSAGKLTIKIGGPTSFDKFQVTDATLDGTFEGKLVNGYQPGGGTTFDVFDFTNPRTGDFVTYALDSYPPFGTLTHNYVGNSLIITAVVTPNADVSISKSGPAGVTSGQNVTYTITVTNNSTSDSALNVIVGDTPANLTFVSNSGACTGSFPCNLGTLAPGQVQTITSTFSTSPSFSGNATNTATVSSTTADPNNTNNSATAITNVGPQADLQVVKTGPASANTGTSITYTVSVKNNGPSTATSVVVSDPTPLGLAFQSNSGGCVTAYPCSLGTITPGQTVTINSTYDIPANFTGTSITNTATASSAVNDPISSNDSSSATTAVGPQTDLSITKSGPTTATAGQNVTYTIVVTNSGGLAAPNVTVTDPNSSGLNWVSNSGACASAFPCNLGTLNPNQSATINATFNIPPAFSGSSVTNTASVSSPSVGDPNTSNNAAAFTTTVTNLGADVAIAKSGPAFVAPGQNITYTITVTNNGPLSAANVQVQDPTPSGVNFVSNTGACATPFPCSLGTLTSGPSVTIISTFNVPAGFTGTSVTNTATVSTTTSDPTSSNNTSTVTTAISTTAPAGADLTVVKSGPGSAQNGQVISFNIDVFNSGPAVAANVSLADPTPAGLTFIANTGACTTPFPCNLGSIGSLQFKHVTAKYVVTAVAPSTITNTATVSETTPDPSNTNNSSTATVFVGNLSDCHNPAPQPIAPAPGATVQSPVIFTWLPVPDASSYIVSIASGALLINKTTTDTTLEQFLPNGSYFWSVAADFNGDNSCPPASSPSQTFIVCSPLDAPLASVVGESTTGQTYAVQWTEVAGANGYEIQEANNPDFNNPTSFTVPGTSKTFTKTSNTAVPFFYRVRATSCGGGSFSKVISVVVVPLPAPTDRNINIVFPVGSTQPVTFTLFIPGLSAGPTSFVATIDKPWLSISPTGGIVPPAGINLTISADPASLVNGTFTGTVIVIYGTPVSSTIGRAQTDVTAQQPIPISVSLVTPVTPVQLSAASGALVVPSVGHLAGSSQWQSDVRIANLAAASQKYLLTFNTGTGGTSASVKTTTVNVDSGATLALDDVVRTTFGVGSLNDSANGMLLIQQLDNSGKVITTDAITKNTAVTSRTFNTAATVLGTLGQFVPAIPFTNFLSNTTAAASMQQLSQNSAFHTNVGIVEAAGKSANVLINAFDGSGKSLFSLPMTINGGQQLQINNLLAQQGVSAQSNARVEVKVGSGDGRVTAYASVIDSTSSDPFLVPPVTLSAAGTNRYVISGVADLTTSIATWRSDLRMFNAGAGPQNTTLTFYPLGNPAGAVSKDVVVQPGEVKALDNLVQSLFNATNLQGSLHVTTPNNAPMVVTSRTFDQTSNGTLGQFITAVTPADAVGAGERSLQLLQAEESARYRTNVGVVEVSGKPATAEITITLPDSKVSPKVTVPLAAFEARQIDVLGAVFGNSAVYNARISVKVTEGTGKITAYGSVVDQTTQAPTYIPAQ